MDNESIDLNMPFSCISGPKKRQRASLQGGFVDTSNSRASIISSISKRTCDSMGSTQSLLSKMTSEEIELQGIENKRKEK
jgi:hypothetical protein